MKKNLMMRIASIMLIAVLITTCGISGTYAKYVTSDDATDTARVAHWGVVTTVTGSAFAEEYETDLDPAAKDKNGNDITKVVVTSTNEKLVAPGTEGTFVGVAVTGSPEVAVNINTEATVTLNGWTLTGDTFYCPIVITINGTEYCGLDYSSATNFVGALESAIETANGNYAANTDLSTVTGLNGNYTWKWAFEDTIHSTHTHGAGTQTDGKDTELGNQAANGFLNNITISVETTVTQID